MVARPSLKARVALAIALLIGFYVLALGMAAGLVYIPFAVAVYGHEAPVQILIFCFAGAFAIVRGIIPRRDRFDPPGPRITEADQPRLFASIQDVAKATLQQMPADVYLIPDVNAFVAQRGGVMGIGSRRVMGIGLPLLEAFTVPQFRAVVAHEFGHYYGGDTKLGPWIYKTRAAITRTLESIGRHGGGLLQKPFIWYGTAFSRVTLAVSRRQEYVADELAARICGAANVAGTLMVLQRAGNAFSEFMRQELVTVVVNGFRPPLVEGFARFQSAPRMRSHLDKLLATAIETGDAGPLDSHPSLKQRLAALTELGAREASDDGGPRAITLVDDLPQTEAAVVASMLRDGMPALVPITWEEVPTRVLPVAWIKLVGPALRGLDGMSAATFPKVAAGLKFDADALVRQLGVARNPNDPGPARYHAQGILGAALALVLDELRVRKPEAVRLTAPPGEPVEFRILGGDRDIVIEPFAVLPSLREGRMEPSAWLETCRAADIVGADLGAVARRADSNRAQKRSRQRSTRRHATDEYQYPTPATIRDRTSTSRSTPEFE